MAAQQADANLLLLAVCAGAGIPRRTPILVSVCAWARSWNAARQFERWSEVAVEWDVGSRD